MATGIIATGAGGVAYTAAAATVEGSDATAITTGVKAALDTVGLGTVASGVKVQQQ